MYRHVPNVRLFLFVLLMVDVFVLLEPLYMTSPPVGPGDTNRMVQVQCCSTVGHRDIKKLVQCDTVVHREGMIQSSVRQSVSDKVLNALMSL